MPRLYCYISDQSSWSCPWFCFMTWQSLQSCDQRSDANNLIWFQETWLLLFLWLWPPSPHFPSWLLLSGTTRELRCAPSSLRRRRWWTCTRTRRLPSALLVERRTTTRTWEMIQSMPKSCLTILHWNYLCGEISENWELFALANWLGNFSWRWPWQICTYRYKFTGIFKNFHQIIKAYKPTAYTTSTYCDWLYIV